MTYNFNMLVLSFYLMAIFCCWAATKVDEESKDRKTNDSLMKDNKLNGKHFNYLRLPDGECHNCSTYKCTNQKTNMGGSEWCIMLFSDALNHCDSDPNCGGYTMTTAPWFHTKYDKNGQVAVHLNKLGEKSINCSLSEWSTYEKQKTLRSTPVVYGRSTCEHGHEETCHKPFHFNYVFVSNSNVGTNSVPYLCKDHPNRLDKTDVSCILPIADALTVCNLDDQCEGFLINTEENGQKKFTNNGMQAVQLIGQGATLTGNDMWRSFKKQY